MARDPLAVLARLRRMETEAARRLVGQAVGRVEAAAQRVTSATVALEAERAEHPLDYGTWLPRGLAARDRALAAGRISEAALAESRILLGEARAAERVVETLQEARTEALAKQLGRKAQARLDEAAARRRPR